MKKPPAVPPNEEVFIIAKVFDTPLVAKGKTWLPLTQCIAFPLLAWAAGRNHPERTWKQRFRLAALTMPVVLGSEWCHNLSHAAAAKMAGKTADAIRIVWGMPLLVYYDINDPKVTPRQHIQRALGGPVFNALLLPVASLLRHFSRQDSAVNEMAGAAIAMNVFLLAVGLLPIPGLDGGVILKWMLVEHGQTPSEADQAVRKLNRYVSASLAVGAAAAVKKKRRLLGGFLGMLSVMALGIALGWIKEKNSKTTSD